MVGKRSTPTARACVRVSSSRQVHAGAPGRPREFEFGDRAPYGRRAGCLQIFWVHACALTGAAARGAG